MANTKPEKMAYTVTEFCFAYGVSRGRLHELQRVGLAPKIYYIASKPYISRKSADEWIVRMENGEGANFERPSTITKGGACPKKTGAWHGE